MTGYHVGTEVIWDLEVVPQTGLIETVYREPKTVEIGNQTIQVQATRDSPGYLILKPDGQYVVLSHQDIRPKAAL